MGDIFTNDAFVFALLLCCIGSRVAGRMMNGRSIPFRRGRQPPEEEEE